MNQYHRLYYLIVLVLLGLCSHVLGQPVPAVSTVSEEEEFINEEFCFTTTFSLSGDPGYGPYVRIMIPADVTVNSISFLGTSLTYTKVGAFPAGTVALADPISTDSVRAADGAVAGDTLFVAELPVGSVVSTTPEFEISICVTFNDEATLDSNYTFTVQPALEFGDTPTGTNGPIYGTANTDQTKPILVKFTKDNDAPEEERPPGPSWPYTYELAIDVANLKTLTNLTFADELPAHVTWVGSLTTTGGTGCSANYDAGTRTVSATCSSVTGTTSDDEVTVSFQVHVNDILDENNCTRDEIPNAADFEALYEGLAIAPDSARDTLEVEHFSIQTSVSPTSVLPDDQITYTTVFQITDFDSTSGNLNPVDALVIVEKLPLGVSFDASVTPTIALSGGTTLAATSITPTVDTLSGDTIQVTFDIHAVTGDIADGTAGTLTYKALVRQHYDLAQTDPLLARDTLTKSITATYDLEGKVSSCTDGSSVNIRITDVSSSLTVVTTPGNTVCYVPGEVVTFKLTMDIPSGDTEDIIFENFFPLPVFDVSALDTDNFGSGQDIRLAPDHTDASFVPLTANITKDASQNSFKIVWPDLDGSTTTKTLSVYVDLPIDYQPFDDGLYLSDIFQYTTSNSDDEETSALLIDYVNICAPDVSLSKGISGTTGDGTIDPDPVGNPVDSDIEGVDAGDTVTFVLTAVNIGGAVAYDLNVKDSIAAGVTNCGLITIDPVKYGDGTAVNISSYSGSPFDANGMTIDSIFAAGDASSRDTITVTCSCEIGSNISPDTLFYNYGKTQWRSAPVAVYADAGLFDLEIDSASIQTDRPTLSKTLTTISPNGSNDGDILAPGDTVTYTLTVRLPEGETPALVVTDTLPEGLAYVSGSVVIDDASFTGTVSGSPSVSTAGDGTSGNAQTIDFTFGNTTTTNNNINTDDSFTLMLEAVALDNAANSGAGSLQSKTNQAEITYTNLSGDAITATDDTQLGEPDVEVSLSISPSTGVDGGDQLTFTITLDNNGTTPVYDLTVTDDLDGLDDFIDLTTISNTTSSMGSWSYNLIGSAATFSLTGTDILAAGGQQVFTFTADLDDNVLPNTTYNNQVSVAGSSQPGTPPEERSTTADASDQVTTATPTIAKSLNAVSPDGTGTGGTQVTAGDTLIYDIVVTLTEGTTTDLVITDNLPPGFQPSTYTVVPGTFDGSVSTSPTVGTSGSLASGLEVTLTFSGNTTLNGDNNSANNTFTIQIEAVVMDNSNNSGQNSLQTKTNEVILTSSSISGTSISATHVLSFAEPKVTINKWIDEDTLDAGDTLRVELRVENKGTSMAHDVVVTDTLDSNLFDLAGVVLVNAYGFTYDYTSPTVKFTIDTLLTSDGRIDLEFKVPVKTGVVTGTSFSNVGIVTATTQTGTPDEERSKTRTNTEAIYTQGVPVMTKSLISSTDVNTSGEDAAIGEILTYQIAVTFPEGFTNDNGIDPLLTDTLPVGFQYISSPSQSAEIYAVADYNGGQIITSVAGTLDGTPVSITPSVSGTASTGQVLGFDIGDVTNNDDQVANDTDTEQLIVTYEVLVLNTTDNNAGDSKPNYVSLQYQDGDANQLSTKDTVTVTIKEPDLGMTTVLSPAGGTATGMTTVTITTKWYNSNSTYAATAYNLSLRDDLPDGFLGTSAGANAPAITSAIYAGDASSVSDCFEFGGDGNELIFDATNGGCTLDLLHPNDTITVVYTAVIDSLTDFNETLTTNPTGQGTTLDGATGNTSTGGYNAGTADTDEGERTGSAVNNSSGQAVNDLNTTATDNFTLAEPSLSKTGDTNLAIGDSAMMTLSITLPGGTGENFTITDDLPAGLKFTGDEVTITIPADVNVTNPTPTTSADDDPVAWNFGTLTNESGTDQVMTLQYEVEARNESGNQHNATLTNSAALTYTGSSGASSLEDDATITVIEPNLTIELEDGGGVYGAGSTIPYTVRIINADNGATAHGIDFAAVIPAELLGGSSPFYDNIVVTNTSGSAVLTGTGTAVSGSDVSLGTSSNTGDQLSLASFDLPANDTLLITFESTVIPNATAAGSFDVTARADYNSLLDNDSRGRDNSTNPGTVDDDNDTDLNNYEESGSVTTDLTASVAIVQSLNSFHSSNDFTIGDSVIYDLKVFLPEGVVNNVVVIDSLPDGLGFMSATRIDGANMSFSSAMSDDGVVGNAGKITFDLSNVTNTADGDASNDTVTIRLVAQVLDDGTNNIAGNSQDNYARVTTSVNSTPELANTVSIDIIEPALSVSITPDNATPSLGETVTMTVTVNNTGGAIAHDVDMASLLADLNLTYTGSFNDNSSGFSLDATDTDSLVFSADQVAASSTVSFTFEVQVDSAATVDSTFTVSIGLTDSYDSQDGDPSNPWVERSYLTNASTTLTPTLHVIDAQKTVSYNDANTNSQLDVGETLTYTIVLTNNTGASAENVNLIDILPANVTYVSSSISSTAGTTDDSNSPTLSVAVGTLANGASTTITFQATVDAGTADGTLISNQGIVTSDQTEPEPTDLDGIDANGDQPTDVIVGPRPALVHDLYAQKVVTWLTDTDNSSTVTATDIMRYTFILENEGNGQLTGVSLTDDIPDGLSFSAAGTPSEGSVNTASFPSISWTGITLEVGEVATLTLDVSIDALSGADDTYTNQGTVDSDQTGEGQTDSNGDPSDGYQATTFAAVNSIPASANIDVEKRWIQSLDNDDDGLIDPTDRYTYEITVMNTGSAPATHVMLADSAPTHTVLVGDSVISSQGIVLAAQSDSIRVNLGTINPGGIAMVSIEVSPSSASDGELIPNQAFITSPEVNSGNALGSDDNGDDDDGLNPTQTPIYTGSGTLDAGDITKTLTATSESQSLGENVLIGEVVTYEIEWVVPKGNLSEVTLWDTLPEGLIYLPGSATLTRDFDTGLNASADPGSINDAAADVSVALTDGSDISIVGDTAIALYLGDIINSDTDGTDETYTLSFQAVVSNESGIGNDAGQTLTTDGHLSYIDGINQGQNLAIASNPTVTIHESNVAIDQTASSSWILTAGGTIAYTLTVTNPAGANVATAFDLVVTDSLPFDTDEWTSMTLTSSGGTGNTGAITNNSDLANGRLSIGVDSLPAGETLTIVFRASSEGTTPLTLEADSMDNTAWVTSSSLPGTQGTGSVAPGDPGDIDGERTSGGAYPDIDYQDSAITHLSVFDLAFTKTILDEQSYYTIGDTISYQLAVAVPNTVGVGSAIIQDALPSGVSYVSSSLLNASGNVYPSAIVTDPGTDFTVSGTGADTLSLSIGDISNTTGSADTIVMTFWGIVTNDLANQYNSSTTTGTNLNANAQESFMNPIHPDGAFRDTLADNAATEVGEPHLTISNTISSGNPVLRGGTVGFTVVIGNDGATPAYDVTLEDAVTTYLANIDNLVVSSATGGATTPSLTNNGTSWSSGGFDIPVGGAVTITFTADVDANAPLGDLDPNTITGRFSGMPGTPSVERDDRDGGNQDDLVNLNNYILSEDPSNNLTVFPVELIDFNATWTNDRKKDARIEWSTASELNNAYFGIERSLDGLSWEEIGRQGGTGTTTEEQTYSMKDKGVGRLLPDDRVFYRLYQVDFDGAQRYLPRVELLTLDDQDQLQVWPNPFGEVIHVEVTGKYGIKEMALYDAQGRIVYEFDGTTHGQTQRVKIDNVSLLPEGNYVLVVALQNGNKQLIKLIKLL